MDNSKTLKLFELCTSQRYRQNFETNWKKNISATVENFARSVNFWASRKSSLKRVSQLLVKVKL